MAVVQQEVSDIYFKYSKGLEKNWTLPYDLLMLVYDQIPVTLKDFHISLRFFVLNTN